MNKQKNIIVISAPSGGGKSVVSRHILSKFPNVNFSISTTTREKRSGEEDGKHYYFISKEEFQQKIDNNEFVEYEKIFGNYYGTLKSEVENILSENKVLLFDIDVKGAYSIKNEYPEKTILIFLKPPSIEVLMKRLRGRETEKEEQIQKRISRAQIEIDLSKNFDYIVINDNLQKTLAEIDKIMNKNI
jgi:guanylate kinase